MWSDGEGRDDDEPKPETSAAAAAGRDESIEQMEFVGREDSVTNAIVEAMLKNKEVLKVHGVGDAQLSDPEKLLELI